MTTARTRPATEARKREILSAALDCFDATGVEPATIQDIQRQAGCSVGSLYHHFGSKEGVAEALWLALIEEFNVYMLARLGKAESAEDAVRGVVQGYINWSVRHPKRMRYLHARDIEFSPEGRARKRELHGRYIAEVFALFARFVRDGQLAELPPYTYVPLISGPIEAYVRRWLTGDAPSPRGVESLFADAAWNAVKGASTSR
ncbi:MAG: TetR/AcrR family transcriptional regulator [Pseudomonadales bacterium]